MFEQSPWLTVTCNCASLCRQHRKSDKGEPSARSEMALVEQGVHFLSLTVPGERHA